MSRQPTVKQSEARMRNWRIRSLRALAGLCKGFAPVNYELVMQAIDSELEMLGAEPESVRHKRIWDEIYKELGLTR